MLTKYIFTSTYLEYSDTTGASGGEIFSLSESAKVKSIKVLFFSLAGWSGEFSESVMLITGPGVFPARRRRLVGEIILSESLITITGEVLMERERE